MQRGVLLAVGAVVLVVAGGLVARNVARQQAGKAVDANINALEAYLPPGTAIQHGATDYNPITGTLTVHAVTVGLASSNATLTADSVTVSGAHPDLLQAVFDPQSYPAGRPAWTDRRLLLETATVHNLHIADPSSQTTWRTLVLHRLSGHPFSLPPTPENRARPGFALEAALDFTADGMEGRDLVFANGGEKSVTISLTGLKFGHYDAGRLGSFAMDALSVEAPARPHVSSMRLSAGAFTLDDLDAHALLLAAQAGQRNAFGLATPTYASAELSHVTAASGQGPAVALQDFRVDNRETDTPGVREGVGKLRGLTLGLGDLLVPPNVAPEVAAFGMRAITMDIDATSRNQRTPPLADLSEDVTLRDLGTLRLKAAVSGLGAHAAVPGNPMAPLMAASIEHATLVWEDGSLTDRLLKVAAAQMHATPELVRAQLAMPVATLGVMLPDQPDAAEQVTAFLNHPHRLTVTLNPPQKVTLGEVGAAPLTQRAHLLGVHVTAD